MITSEMLQEANERLSTIKIKGKDYAMVKDRVKAFREICPGGAIVSELISFANGTAVFKTTIYDEDQNELATGHAYEKEGSSQINSSSYLENAESSSVGRALGFLGVGIDGSMASADEVANAIEQQNDQRPATDVEKRIFTEYCKRLGVEPKDVLVKTGWKAGNKMTVEQQAKGLIILTEIENARE